MRFCYQSQMHFLYYFYYYSFKDASCHALTPPALKEAARPPPSQWHDEASISSVHPSGQGHLTSSMDTRGGRGYASGGADAEGGRVARRSDWERMWRTDAGGRRRGRRTGVFLVGDGVGNSPGRMRSLGRRRRAWRALGGRRARDSVQASGHVV